MYNNRNNKRYKTHHNQPRPSLPSIHQILPSPPPLQVLLPPFISLTSSLSLFSSDIELYPDNDSDFNDEQILENASLFFFGNNSINNQTRTISTTRNNNNNKRRRDFILFDPRDYPPTSTTTTTSSFKGKLVPDLGLH